MSILIPILLAILFPVLLGIGGLLQLAPNIRFKLAAILVLAVWTIISLWILKATPDEYGRWLAGFLFLSSAIILVFLPWSVMCWGYTLSMLLRLAESNKAINQQQWAEKYAGAAGVSGLSKNRASVLIGLRFAFIENSNLVLTKLGGLAADILQLLSRCLGIAR